MTDILPSLACIGLVLLATRALSVRVRTALDRARDRSGGLIWLLLIPLALYAGTKATQTVTVRFEPPLADAGTSYDGTNLTIRIDYPPEIALENFYVDASTDGGTNWTRRLESKVHAGPWSLPVETNAIVFVWSSFEPPAPVVTNASFRFGIWHALPPAETNRLISPQAPIRTQK